MDLLHKHICFAREFRPWKQYFLKVKKTLEFTWSAYSKPTPNNTAEFLTLLLLCFSIAVITGGLSFNWMFYTLGLEYCASGVTAGIYSIMAFLLLFFVHPVRCMFTMIIPTLGTKQGSKLIISTSVMLIALKVIPNMVTNINVIMYTLKCSASTSAENVINSTELLNNATKEIGQEVLKINKEMQNVFKASLGDFDLAANVNVSEIRKEFHVVSQQVANDFLLAKMVLEETKLVTSRLLAGLFVLCLLIGSSWYLKGYLTDMKFDNVYITKQLEHLARENGRRIMPTAGLINSRGFKMSRRESFRCLVRLAVITLYLLLIISVIVADRIVFSFIVTSAPWLYDFPVIPMTIRVTYSAELILGFITIKKYSFQKDYHWNFTLTSRHCITEPSEPDRDIAILVGALYLLAYIMVICEIYATRIRRKISASFFKKQEEKRVHFLYQKIIAKEERNKNDLPVYIIKTSDNK
ncbi:osteoclast stimulatory transmembrane protein [Acipenser ruthenus]|uniref:osteoclast stimulatory transmembrane protein n=1 Tax=Acipenser ruthenus TaxID=7906 RepID=UPI00145AF264|nr:osteoclast stimulatory transmembrane protein [Acipenser ruthenus]